MKAEGGRSGSGETGAFFFGLFPDDCLNGPPFVQHVACRKGGGGGMKGGERKVHPTSLWRGWQNIIFFKYEIMVKSTKKKMASAIEKGGRYGLD